MGRWLLRAAQAAVTVLFVMNFQQAQSSHWTAWLVPMVLIVLVVMNSLRFTRLVSWVIFAVAFFAFLVLLSAFTMGWRSVPSFDAGPFYRAIIMYVLFIYISLGQIKLLGSPKATREGS